MRVGAGRVTLRCMPPRPPLPRGVWSDVGVTNPRNHGCLLHTGRMKSLYYAWGAWGYVICAVGIFLETCGQSKHVNLAPESKESTSARARRVWY